MAKVSMHSAVNMGADQLWKMIGQFNALPDWHPAVTSSKLTAKGKATIEWSSEFDPAGASAIDATAAVQDVFKMGLENLRKMFGG